MEKSIPNSNNFCGGNFQDWIEVNLLEKCNGRCEWCIERGGYHPKFHADWRFIAERSLLSGKPNIILLGGEPTLHKDLDKIIKMISSAGRNVWITTNGSMLTKDFIHNVLDGIHGINISIHSHDLEDNEEITGIKIGNLQESIKELHNIGASIRLNCNCISGYIDSVEEIETYIKWAKEVGADKIRFAELKQQDDSFIDLAKTMSYQYGLNDDPFTCGCHSDAVIFGMPVNFRQMCGLQTQRRVKPENPEQYAKRVLYYDGNFYDGWQTAIKEEVTMEDKEIVAVLKKVEDGEITAEAALVILRGLTTVVVSSIESSGGCQY